MKFEKDKILIGSTVEETKLIEGGINWLFAQRAMADLSLNASELDILEIGPKHGYHTQCLDAYEPHSMTCVESPTKFRDAEVFYNYNARWMPRIKCDSFDFHYTDFANFYTNNKYNLLFYTGVIYHNIDQISHLRKLYELASENAYMIFGSSTTRNEKLKDMNVIEVHYPPYSPYYKGVKSCKFHPSRIACMSMLEMTGWEVLFNESKYEDIRFERDERIVLIAKKKNENEFDYWNRFVPGKISMNAGRK